MNVFHHFLFLAKPVNGENYIHVHFKSQAGKITERDIKNASSLIMQNVGVKTVGTEIYLRKDPSYISDGIFSFLQFIFFNLFCLLFHV